jgi:hypothetical protein
MRPSNHAKLSSAFRRTGIGPSARCSPPREWLPSLRSSTHETWGLPPIAYEVRRSTAPLEGESLAYVASADVWSRAPVSVERRLIAVSPFSPLRPDIVRAAALPGRRVGASIGDQAGLHQLA